MGRILIRELNFSLQTKSNPRIIYLFFLFLQNLIPPLETILKECKILLE